jgi:hypothetical protein
MMSVAFFRNLNQGQRGSPSSAALATALRAAGAGTVTLVRGNGTAVFDAADPLAAADLAARDLAPWRDRVFVRDGGWLRQLVGGIDDASDSRRELTLFDDVDPGLAIPARGVGCTIVATGVGYALVENDGERRSNGTPTVERLLGTPATSRGLPTLRKVVSLLGTLD